MLHELCMVHGVCTTGRAVDGIRSMRYWMEPYLHVALGRIAAVVAAVAVIACGASSSARRVFACRILPTDRHSAQMHAPYHPAVRPSLCAWFVMFLKLGKTAKLTIGFPWTADTQERI